MSKAHKLLWMIPTLNKPVSQYLVVLFITGQYTLQVMFLSVYICMFSLKTNAVQIPLFCHMHAPLAERVVEL